MPTKRNTRRKPAGTHIEKRNERVVSLVSKREEVKAPRAPAGLSTRSKEAWRGFWKSPVAQAVDMDADGERLHRWIRYVDQWHRFMRVLEAEPFVTGSTGQVKVNPAADQVKRLEGAIAEIEDSFGMNSMARLKLGIAYGQAQQTALDLNQRIRESVRDEAGEQAEWAKGFEATD
jgi:P27 family predicted phage terminase small subunit